MLLVTFHGGSPDGAVNNVLSYDTTATNPPGVPALHKIDASKLAELRAMLYADGFLYVVNGSKKISNILTFQPKSGHFDYVCDFLDSVIAKKLFQTSIAHPYSLAFDDAGFVYISNQDTNVVAQATVASGFQTAKLNKGCQSAYLNGLQKNGVFLDGTFVASQVGTLEDVAVNATDIASASGGLAVSPTTGKVQNSVRDVAVANGMLFVCDEPSMIIRIYALPDGDYLGASAALADKPTHMTLQNGGLYVSAGANLYWSPLPASSTTPSLEFQSVATAPSGTKIGGISFEQSDSAATVYACFQLGTGGAFGGTIQTFNFTQAASGTAPTLTTGPALATGVSDTPEFCLYLPDSLL